MTRMTKTRKMANYMIEKIFGQDCTLIRDYSLKNYKTYTFRKTFKYDNTVDVSIDFHTETSKYLIFVTVIGRFKHTKHKSMIMIANASGIDSNMEGNTKFERFADKCQYDIDEFVGEFQYRFTHPISDDTTPQEDKNVEQKQPVSLIERFNESYVSNHAINRYNLETNFDDRVEENGRASVAQLFDGKHLINVLFVGEKVVAVLTHKDNNGVLIQIDDIQNYFEYNAIETFLVDERVIPLPISGHDLKFIEIEASTIPDEEPCENDPIDKMNPSVAETADESNSTQAFRDSIIKGGK